MWVYTLGVRTPAHGHRGIYPNTFKGLLALTFISILVVASCLGVGGGVVDEGEANFGLYTCVNVVLFYFIGFIVDGLMGGTNYLGCQMWCVVP